MNSDNNFEKESHILNQRFYLLLENFKKNYILHKENPNYHVNKKKFESSLDELQSCYKDLVLLDNKLEKKTNSLNYSLKDDRLKFNSLKEENTKLKEKLEEIDKGDFTTEQMYEDNKVIYKQRYIRFIVCIIGLLILFLFLYIVSKEEPYTIDSDMPLWKKATIVISIILLVLVLSTRSLGFDILKPIKDFFTERGFFSGISLNI